MTDHGGGMLCRRSVDLFDLISIRRLGGRVAFIVEHMRAVVAIGHVQRREVGNQGRGPLN